jgi:PAS domain S-box-containing protein
MGVPLRLLFISNDPAIIEGVADALHRSFPGLEASGAHDTQALARALHQGGYDVVITDYQLGWTDGSAVVTTVKERWPECPVVIFSVSGSDELTRDLDAMRRAGPGAEPPESIALLAGTIRAALDRAELSRERRGAEEALRESEARFRSVFESASDAIVLADQRGTILSWNHGAQAMFGYDASEIVGKPLSVLMPERYRERHQEGLERLRRGGEPRVLGSTLQMSGLRRDGTEFDIELALGAWDTGQGTNFSGVIRDVSERKSVEEALRRTNRQLRSLSTRLAEIQELERSTIARKVHDELGGALTALGMDVAWVRKRLAEYGGGPGPVFARLNGMAKMVESTIDRIRRISAELRPQILDQLGLVAAIQWQAGEFEARTGIACRVRAAEMRVSRTVSTGLFRTVQECLTNVARHSGAHSVEIRLRREPGSLVLEVRDDGAGIASDVAESPGSMGLRGIQERAAQLGGEASIIGGATGTAVFVAVPVAVRPARRALGRGAVA